MFRSYSNFLAIVTKAVTNCFPTCNIIISDIRSLHEWLTLSTEYLDNVGGGQEKAVCPVLVVLRQLECVAVVNVLSDVPGVVTLR